MKKVVDGFSGQARHEVDAGFHAEPVGEEQGVFGIAGAVSAAYADEGGVIQGLHAGVEPELGPGRVGHERHFFFVEAVGTGADAGADETGQRGEFLQHGGETGGRSVGIGERLDVAEKEPGASESGHGGVAGAPAVPLITQTAESGAGTGAFRVAEGAARRADGAVAVGTGGTGVEGDFLHLFSERGAQVPVEGAIARDLGHGHILKIETHEPCPRDSINGARRKRARKPGGSGVCVRSGMMGLSVLRQGGSCA